ncbi:zinc finger protein 227 isoform X1 [Acyrthosiphon pisum]|uniref:C2H2-type domain-containing protein n=1 Tax=Acyrthosiphon pisum TaxID=7029 RepID=A0A8R2A8T3_ACYPI|nr:zinc finger protein 227 isoform X1 [Acyrthosiphon pisum]|eukprot:XP_001951371.2 PREDICTED: zinc finger protein 227 isoform X1 [Acyrthosiphon pisum]
MHTPRYTNQKMIKEERVSMETLQPSMLSIPLSRCDDPVYNKVIKQENIEETDSNCDNTISEIGNTWNTKREVNATDINIKYEKDTIEICEFYGHIKMETSEIEEPFFCAMCNILYYRKSDLRKHILHHKELNKFTKQKNIGEKGHNNDYTILQRGYDDIFQGSRELSIPLIICDDPVYNKVIKQTNIDEQFCDKSFAPGELTMPHTGENPYRSDICKKGFSGSYVLRQHTRTYTKEKLYSCDICGKSFTRSTYLKVHSRIHTGEKPFVCDICGKSFNHISNLNVHRRIHTGEKLFVCDICGKSFTRSTFLKVHRNIHTAEKSNKCKVCDKSFASLQGLRRHAGIHTGEKPFGCDICYYSFSSSSNLKVHKRTHTGEKLFICDICDKSFSISSNLKRHKRTHTGENL